METDAGVEMDETDIKAELGVPPAGPAPATSPARTIERVGLNDTVSA